MSWKVRKSAAKTLQAMVGSYPERLASFMRSLIPVLLKRFRGEREQSVRLDVFSVLTSLLLQAKAVTGSENGSLTAEPSTTLETKKRKSSHSAVSSMEEDDK